MICLIPCTYSAWPNHAEQPRNITDQIASMCIEQSIIQSQAFFSASINACMAGCLSAHKRSLNALNIPLADAQRTRHAAALDPGGALRTRAPLTRRCTRCPGQSPAPAAGRRAWAWAAPARLCRPCRARPRARRAPWPWAARVRAAPRARARLASAPPPPWLPARAKQAN